MKKAGRITLLVAGILYVIIGLVFIVIEGRVFSRSIGCFTPTLSPGPSKVSPVY